MVQVPNLERIFGPMTLIYDVRDEEVKKFIERLDGKIRKALMEMLMTAAAWRVATCFVDKCIVRVVDERDVKKIIERGWEPEDLEISYYNYDYYVAMWLKSPTSLSAAIRIYTPDANNFNKKQYEKYQAIIAITEAFRKVKELQEELEECRKELEELKGRGEEDEEEDA